MLFGQPWIRWVNRLCLLVMLVLGYPNLFVLVAALAILLWSELAYSLEDEVKKLRRQLNDNQDN